MPEAEPRFQPGDELLDLFCRAGGASEGYARAGFKVTGVDIDPQPNYPFDFIQADALEILRDSAFLEKFAALAASPPCQRYSTATRRWGRQSDHPDLIEPVRQLLNASGLPYVIENVTGAPLHGPTILCGSMFGLGVRRHRAFESTLRLPPAPPCSHATQGPIVTVAGHPGGTSIRDGDTGRGSTAQWREAMGIDWMTGAELAEAIPPAYTEWIGNRMMGVPDVGG